MVMTWLFAAMNSVEPFVGELATIDLFNADKPWAKARRPEVESFLRKRLGEPWVIATVPGVGYRIDTGRDDDRG